MNEQEMSVYVYLNRILINANFWIYSHWCEAIIAFERKSNHEEPIAFETRTHNRNGISSDELNF